MTAPIQTKEVPSEPGPISFRNELSIICRSESLSVLSKLPECSVDLVFADPPYNIGKKFGSFSDSWPSETHYVRWCEQWLTECLRILKSHGSLYLMSSTQAMPHLDIWLSRRMSILSRIVWHYDSSGVQARRRFGSMYEPILFAVKDPAKYTFNADEISVEAKTGAVRKLIDYRKEVPSPYKTTKLPGNVWYFPRVRYRMSEYEEHPSQKPEALLERIILASTNPGDLIVDPFAGTCTTGAVAQRLGRRSMCIEAEGKYVEIGLRRLGVSTELDGRELKAPVKKYVRRNARGVKGGVGRQGQSELFYV